MAVVMVGTGRPSTMAVVAMDMAAVEVALTVVAMVTAVGTTVVLLADTAAGMEADTAAAHGAFGGA